MEPGGRSSRPLRAPRGIATVAARALLLLGALCVGWWGLDMGRAALARAGAGRRLEAVISAATAARRRGEVARPAPASVNVGDAIGWISIPRLHLRSVVMEGDDDLTLSFAVGHVPGTALPGAGGNVALAGHRDTDFSHLSRVRVGDSVVLATPGGRYLYVVRSTRVTGPDDVGVLDPTSEPTLTMITCYPFRWVGPAPERFIVRATLVSHDSTPARSGRTVKESA